MGGGNSKHDEALKRARVTLQIEITYEELTGVPGGALSNKKLTRAVFAGNKITSLPNKIKNWQQLTCLELDGNQLKALPPVIGQLRALQKLHLAFNQLQALPEPLSQCASLTSVNVSHNQLLTISPGLGELSNLVELDISYNKLETLPDSLGQLKLSKIECRNNLFYRIPPALAMLTEIEELCLQECEMKQLDVTILEAFGRLPKLRVLDISHNNLREIPAETIELYQLREFHLNHNPLKAFPDKVQAMQNLRFNWHDWQATAEK